MYQVLKLIFYAALAGDFLLLCVAVLLSLLVRRTRPRIREREPETPSETDCQRNREIREDIEAFQRLQAYNAEDAYGMGDSG